MKLFCPFAVLSLVLSVSASPDTSATAPRSFNLNGFRIGCLTSSDAQGIRDAYATLFYEFNFTTSYAKSILTKDYQLFSESTNEIANIPGKYPDVSQCTFCSPADVAAYSVNNIPAFFPTYIDLIVGCDSFAFRWRFGSAPIATGGIDIVHVQRNGYKVTKGYQEFNSAGLCSDIPGCKAAFCGTPPPSKV